MPTAWNRDTAFSMHACPNQFLDEYLRTGVGTLPARLANACTTVHSYLDVT